MNSDSKINKPKGKKGVSRLLKGLVTMTVALSASSAFSRDAPPPPYGQPHVCDDVQEKQLGDL